MKTLRSKVGGGEDSSLISHLAWVVVGCGDLVLWVKVFHYSEAKGGKLRKRVGSSQIEEPYFFFQMLVALSLLSIFNGVKIHQYLALY